ncbi:aminotransferase class III-fold pyridoxal phosphate-dependent enzyme, partial [Klebsiella pneumoniae]|nr:aminotransferase class III-fold pyridoxal phosphate-dependent enzyme [Klebsiella pneumoniae]
LDYAPAFQMGHPKAFELASRLVNYLPSPLDHIFFTNSGSESVETALKIAIAYQRARGKASKTRLIGRERGNWFASPRVHVFRRGAQDGSTILNLAEGNFVFSDAEGTVEVVATNGDRQLTVKDAAGKVLFQG